MSNRKKWELVNGPVPEGHVIISLDGELKCLTRKEMMAIARKERYKKVYCKKLDKVFESCADCGRAIGYSRTNVWYICNGYSKHNEWGIEYAS